jgi:DNA-binding transcriptional ArsR family regulator
LDLKKLLASSLRQKILKALSECRKINVMGLVRRTNSTYNEVNRNLTILKKEGIISDTRCGRMRLLKLDRENSKTILLLQVLKQLESEKTMDVAQAK